MKYCRIDARKQIALPSLILMPECRRKNTKGKVHNFGMRKSRPCLEAAATVYCERTHECPIFRSVPLGGPSGTARVRNSLCCSASVLTFSSCWRALQVFLRGESILEVVVYQIHVVALRSLLPLRVCTRLNFAQNAYFAIADSIRVRASRHPDLSGRYPRCTGACLPPRIWKALTPNSWPPGFLGFPSFSPQKCPSPWEWSRQIVGGPRGRPH